MANRAEEVGEQQDRVCARLEKVRDRKNRRRVILVVMAL
jgi:hypothetical protein